MAAIAVALLAPMPALADSKSGNEELGDPNRKICRVQHHIGSRLKKGKICMTAAEWASAKAASRDALERAQQSKPTTRMDGAEMGRTF
jgi:hypothetical protein